jgi:hypothetical protein
MAQMMLNGNVDNRDHLIEDLQDQVRELQRKLIQAGNDLHRAQTGNARALGTLRNTLEPFYKVLQVIFGAIEDIGYAEDTTGPGQAKVHPAWESWMRKLPGSPAKMIESLLTQKEMTAAQLRVTMQCRLQTVYDAATKLKGLGLITKNNGKYSLKEL